jgi:hypothetical protein
VWQATAGLDGENYFPATGRAQIDVHLHEDVQQRGPHWVANWEHIAGTGLARGGGGTIESFEIALGRFWELHPLPRDTRMQIDVQAEVELSPSIWNRVRRRLIGEEPVTTAGKELKPAFRTWQGFVRSELGLHTLSCGIYEPGVNSMFFNIESREQVPTDGRIFGTVFERARDYIQEAIEGS